jgi:hypothetical protein
LTTFSYENLRIHKLRVDTILYWPIDKLQYPLSFIHSYIQTNPGSFSSLFEFIIMSNNSFNQGRRSNGPNPIDLPEEDSGSTTREEQVKEADQIMTMVLSEKQRTFLYRVKTNDQNRLAGPSNDVTAASRSEDETRRREKSILSIPGAFRVHGIEQEQQDQSNQAADDESTISSGSDDSSVIYVVPRAAFVDEEQKNPMTPADPVLGFEDEIPLQRASVGVKGETVLVKNRWIICLALVFCLIIAGLAVGLTVAMMDRSTSFAVVGADNDSSSVFTAPAPSPPSGNKKPRPRPNGDGSGGSGGGGSGGRSGGGGSGGYTRGSDGSVNDGD